MYTKAVSNCFYSPTSDTTTKCEPAKLTAKPSNYS